MKEGARTPLGALERRGWLAEQSAGFRRRLRAMGRLRKVSKGQPIYTIDEAPDGLHGVASGAFVITVPVSSDDVAAIYRAEVGSWIGESALLAESTRTISVHAATDAEVFSVPAAPIRAMLAQEPRLWSRFYALSHRNATLAARALADALALSPRARLARMLLRNADAAGAVAATQEEVPQLIGMTRSTSKRAVAALAGAGAVRQEYARIVILDVARLETLSVDAE